MSDLEIITEFYQRVLVLTKEISGINHYIEKEFHDWMKIYVFNWSRISRKKYTEEEGDKEFPKLPKFQRFLLLSKLHEKNDFLRSELSVIMHLIQIIDVLFFGTKFRLDNNC